MTALEACPTCAAPFIALGDRMYTCVGYYSPPGHNHDDNCASSSVACANGHRTRFSVQRRCKACDWRGKTNCCQGDLPSKLRAWPIVNGVSSESPSFHGEDDCE